MSDYGTLIYCRQQTAQEGVRRGFIGYTLTSHVSMRGTSACLQVYHAFKH